MLCGYLAAQLASRPAAWRSAWSAGFAWRWVRSGSWPRPRARAGFRLRRHDFSGDRGAVAERWIARRCARAGGRRKGEFLDRAAIRGRAGAAGGAMEARPHVRRRRRRAARRSARLQLFQRDRQYPSGRSAGHPAGAFRRQCLRGARALLSRRHPEFENRGGSDPGPRHVRLCGHLFRRCRRAV